jgi:hypothetical protein
MLRLERVVAASATPGLPGHVVSPLRGCAALSGGHRHPSPDGPDSPYPTSRRPAVRPWSGLADRRPGRLSSRPEAYDRLAGAPVELRIRILRSTPAPAATTRRSWRRRNRPFWVRASSKTDRPADLARGSPCRQRLIVGGAARPVWSKRVDQRSRPAVARGQRRAPRRHPRAPRRR